MSFKESVKKNSNNILVGFGLGAMLLGVASSCYATLKINNNVKTMKEENKDVSKKDIIKKNIKYVIAPAILVTGGAGMIITGTVKTNKQLTALASAYTTTSIAFQNFKDKTVEKIGKKSVDKINAEVANEDSKQIDSNTKVIVTGKGDVLIMEPYTKTVFRSNWDSIRRIALDLHTDAINHGGAITLSNWLEAIGLEKTAISDRILWNPNEGRPLLIDKVGSLTKDDEPCLTIVYENEPVCIN